VIDELFRFAMDVVNAYATDDGGAHPLSQTARAPQAPNFRTFCKALGTAAVALPIGCVLARRRGRMWLFSLAGWRSRTKAGGEHVTRNSWAARLIAAIQGAPSGSYAIMVPPPSANRLASQIH
jgi:hypothetical protein